MLATGLSLAGDRISFVRIKSSRTFFGWSISQYPFLFEALKPALVLLVIYPLNYIQYSLKVYLENLITVTMKMGEDGKHHYFEQTLKFQIVTTEITLTRKSLKTVWGLNVSDIRAKVGSPIIKSPTNM